jgi:hypothetical protein
VVRASQAPRNGGAERDKETPQLHAKCQDRLKTRQSGTSTSYQVEQASHKRHSRPLCDELELCWKAKSSAIGSTRSRSWSQACTYVNCRETIEEVPCLFCGPHRTSHALLTLPVSHFHLLESFFTTYDYTTLRTANCTGRATTYPVTIDDEPNLDLAHHVGRRRRA